MDRYWEFIDWHTHKVADTKGGPALSAGIDPAEERRRKIAAYCDQFNNKTSRRRPLTVEEVEQMLEMRRQGYTYKEIRTALNLKQDYIYEHFRALKALGIDTATELDFRQQKIVDYCDRIRRKAKCVLRNPLRPEEADKMLKLRREGYSYKQIGKMLRRSQEYISLHIQALKALGVE
jgi:transposase